MPNRCPCASCGVLLHNSICCCIFLRKQAIATHDLTTGSVPRHLLRLGTPVVLAMMLQSAYALVDLAFVRQLGEKAVAGLAISFQAFFLILAIGQVVATAALAEISQHYGAKKIDSARVAFSTFCAIAVGLGLVAVVAAYLSAEAYVSTFTDDPQVLELGTGYFEINSLTFLLQLLLIVFGNGLRASGDFSTPMKLMALSVLTNAVLDPLLIFGIGPFPELGLDGAAWATVLAQSQTLVVYLIRLSRPRAANDLYWTRPVLTREVWWRLVFRGLPAGAQFFLISVILGLVLGAVKSEGAAWTAAAGGGFRVLQQLFLPLVALASAAAAISGQNLGARNYDRVWKVAKTALAWGLIYAAVIVAIVYWQSHTLGHVFAKGEEELRVATIWFQWSAPQLFGFAATYVPTFVLQAAGRAVLPLCSALARAAALSGVLYLLIPNVDWPTEAIFGAATVTQLLEGLVDVVLLFVFLSSLGKTAEFAEK